MRHDLDEANIDQERIALLTITTLRHVVKEFDIEPPDAWDDEDDWPGDAPKHVLVSVVRQHFGASLGPLKTYQYKKPLRHYSNDPEVQAKWKAYWERRRERYEEARQYNTEFYRRKRAKERLNRLIRAVEGQRVDDASNTT